jgi:hypothetical protein
MFKSSMKRKSTYNYDNIVNLVVYTITTLIAITKTLFYQEEEEGTTHEFYQFKFKYIRSISQANMFKWSLRRKSTYNYGDIINPVLYTFITSIATTKTLFYQDEDEETTQKFYQFKFCWRDEGVVNLHNNGWLEDGHMVMVPARIKAKEYKVITDLAHGNSIKTRKEELDRGDENLNL